MTAERLFSGLLALVSLSLIYLALGYTAPIAYDPIGPRPYPILIFSLLFVGSITVACLPSKYAKNIQLNFTPVIIRNLVLCVVALLVYGFFFETLGFPIATILMSSAVGMLFGGKAISSIVYSVLLSVSLYILFDILLDVSLPLGFISGLRG